MTALVMHVGPKRRLVRAATLGVVVAASAAMATHADAAMCMDLSTDPARPVALSITKVMMNEQWLATTGNRFELVARREGQADIPLTVSRLSAGSLAWIGQIVFPEAGEWELRVAIAAPENHYPCFEKIVNVAPVGSPPEEPGDRTPVAVAALAALGAALIVFVLGVRSRLARGGAVTRIKPGGRHSA